MENIMKIISILAVLVVGIHCCCFPDQFEGIEGMSAGQLVNGTGIAYQFNFNISVDVKAGMVAYDGVVFYEGKMIKEIGLEDFNKKIQYLVVDGKCQESATPAPGMLACIPEDATKVMSSYFGYKGPVTSFDMYSFKYGGVPITMSVESGSCAPIAEHIQGNNAIYDIGFMGLTPGIKDKRVFDVPAACRKPFNGPMFSHPLRRLRKERPSIFGF